MTQDNQTDTNKNKAEDKSGAAPGADQIDQKGAKGNDKPSVPGDKKPGFSSK